MNYRSVPPSSVVPPTSSSTRVYFTTSYGQGRNYNVGGPGADVIQGLLPGGSGGFTPQQKGWSGGPPKEKFLIFNYFKTHFNAFYD